MEEKACFRARENGKHKKHSKNQLIELRAKEKEKKESLNLTVSKLAQTHDQ